MAAEEASPKRNFSHVIFDMDGLLLDTERIYTEVMQRVASKYGQNFTWELKVKMMGRPGLVSAQIAVDEMQLPITAEKFIEEASIHKNELFPECNLMPGKKYSKPCQEQRPGPSIRYIYRNYRKQFLNLLKAVFANLFLAFLGAEKLVRHLQKHNIPFALASGSFSKDFETKIQRHMDFFSLFKIVVLGDNPEVKQGKPHPDVFLVTANKFQEIPSPSSVLVFEDAPNGVKAGKSANMGVVMVPDKRLDSCFYNNADLVLQSLEEFKPEEWGFPAYNDS